MDVELIDLESANVVASFATEAEALALVRDAIARHGRPYVYTWALGRIDRSEPPLRGDDLAERALRSAAA